MSVPDVKTGNPSLRDLRQALKKIDRPGAFCVSGEARLVHPGLDVTGVGLIGLPLSVVQAKELKKRCEQAPYGKGEETIVDKKVRRVWHMSPSRFALTNPEWDGALGAIVSKVQEELGLEKQPIESHLYDLLLYEPGSFFLPHRDGERLDGMVATLVVTLPSAFKGGELIVRHGGQVQAIGLSGQSDGLFQLHYAAFYADCEHEVRPLADGYRLCLIYNLTLSASRKKITAPRDTEHIDAVRRHLCAWSHDKSAGKLAITLDHQYTEKGLSWDTLKGADRVKARVLCQAAAAAACKAYLSLLTLHESGSAEYVGYGRGPSRSRGHPHYDENSEYEYNEASEYEMGEVYESVLTAQHMIDRDGNGLPIKEIFIKQDERGEELLDHGALKKVKPEVEYEGYTGNEGMTLDRWYRHAAILLWPERIHFDVLCEKHARDVTPLLTEMVAEWERAPEASAEASKARCVRLASGILSNWPDHYYPCDGEDMRQAPDLLKALVLLGERGMIERYLSEIMSKDDSADAGKEIVAACQRYGWQTFKSQLLSICEGTRLSTLGRNIRLLEEICTARPKKKEGHTDLCAALAQRALSALQALEQDDQLPDWQWDEVDRGQLLAGLLRALIASDQQVLLEQLLSRALSLPGRYPLVAAHLSALEQIRPWMQENVHAPCPPLSGWIAACRTQLEALTAEEPQEPTDLRRAASAPCKCAWCQELNTFLANPHQEAHPFRAAQNIRSHLERVIDTYQCDVDYITVRRGSPHTLVCTKTKASFHRALDKYHEDQTHLAKVRSIEASFTA